MPVELHRHKNGYWYVIGTVVTWRNGQPHSIGVRRSTRTKDRDEADAIRRQIESAQAERNITGREPALTFRQAAERYVRHGGEARYVDKVSDHLGTYRIDQITQQIIDDAALAAYPTAADSTRRRQFHTPAIAILRKSGIATLISRPKGGEKRTIFFRPEQADRMLKQISISRYPNPWSGAFATFLFGQGSRVSETLAIDGRNDISLDERYAILRDTKSGKERMVTLCPRVIAAVSIIPNLGHKGPLFLRYDGRPYDERQGNGYQFSWWKRAVTATGLDEHKFTPHTARHSWATWFYSQTKDVVRLKAEGGWDSSEWERYVKLAAPGLGIAAAQYGFDFAEILQNDAVGKADATARA